MESATIETTISRFRSLCQQRTYGVCHTAARAFDNKNIYRQQVWAGRQYVYGRWLDFVLESDGFSARSLTVMRDMCGIKSLADIHIFDACSVSNIDRYSYSCRVVSRGATTAAGREISTLLVKMGNSGFTICVSDIPVALPMAPQGVTMFTWTELMFEYWRELELISTVGLTENIIDGVVDCTELVHTLNSIRRIKRNIAELISRRSDDHSKMHFLRALADVQDDVWPPWRA